MWYKAFSQMLSPEALARKRIVVGSVLQGHLAGIPNHVQVGVSFFAWSCILFNEG
jgi:hypothetical protein